MESWMINPKIQEENQRIKDCKEIVARKKINVDKIVKRFLACSARLVQPSKTLCSLKMVRDSENYGNTPSGFFSVRCKPNASLEEFLATFEQDGVCEMSGEMFVQLVRWIVDRGYFHDAKFPFHTQGETNHPDFGPNIVRFIPSHTVDKIASEKYAPISIANWAYRIGENSYLCLGYNGPYVCSFQEWIVQMNAEILRCKLTTPNYSPMQFGMMNFATRATDERLKCHLYVDACYAKGKFNTWHAYNAKGEFIDIRSANEKDSSPNFIHDKIPCDGCGLACEGFNLSCMPVSPEGNGFHDFCFPYWAKKVRFHSVSKDSDVNGIDYDKIQCDGCGKARKETGILFKPIRGGKNGFHASCLPKGAVGERYSTLSLDTAKFEDGEDIILACSSN